jgi:secreted PhoX family phosphatase
LFSLNVTNPVGPTVQLFVSQSTIDAATGLAVGSGFLNPDNMAIDVLGNIYFTEDIGGVGGTGFDIWMATDADRDGVAESIGRWASVSTLGAEPSGLYFNPFDPTLAYVNIQHTTSDIDRTIEIKVVPEPATFLLLAAGMAGMLVARRGRSRRVS